MSIELAYRFRDDPAPSSLRDLDVIALTADIEGDAGERLAAGTEGTVVSVYRDGLAYVVEFDTEGAPLATVTADKLRLIERLDD